MRTGARRLGTRIVTRMKSVGAAVGGRLAVWLLKAIRRTNPDRIADTTGAFVRRVGPFFPEHRTGRANLAAAFPEKSAAEIEEILRGVWDNLGRISTGSGTSIRRDGGPVASKFRPRRRRGSGSCTRTASLR